MSTKPSLRDCLSTSSITPVTHYLDALSPSERLAELVRLTHEAPGTYGDPVAEKKLRHAILSHYKTFRAAYLDGADAEKADAVQGIYAALIDGSHAAMQYTGVAAPVPALVLRRAFMAGDTDYCLEFIRELFAQERYQDVSHLEFVLTDCIHLRGMVGELNDAEAEAALDLSELVKTMLRGVTVTHNPAYALLPTYTSNKRLREYFVTPGAELPMQMLPNADAEVEDKVKFFLNRRDLAGLGAYVAYTLQELHDDAHRTTSGTLATAHLLAVLLGYYVHLAADADLVPEVTRLQQQLAFSIARLRPAIS